ncbi:MULTISPECIES: toll/interleukin-1 receptor domain-containing protein [Bacillus]|uniref:toll/interleukin-1 receptor domain-containing protein n=1 Tax=Bacillus TaxID=1386 RepID=UPI0003690951|nr:MULTISPECIES: toll/interleukin-1 receptor domain-containing protein [Bacillus]HWO76117.1 toll/interleukin-1 receptor domain-containing protein [Bacillus sp. (in: firmicutes)]MDE1411104.1 toll/interleukin-1 receptor domain-containing protein [Bacillus licheniformis]MDE1419901.1 toll/interleukin-1 receptor domain-containing protein [Bacillus licheniformis]MDE1449724.1 toll/interleukin-1 receptor domain-containing protein [Bacillus licheniformis]MDI3077593.1 toll/interleukin-1 receptor domain-
MLKRIFISYSWESEEHKKLVNDLGEKLENDGLEVTIDQWDVRPGDELALYMERAIKESDYVLIICSEGYKTKADNRIGGSGYEAKIITSNILANQHIKKFIPIYVGGEWDKVAPEFIKGNMYVDLSQPIGSASFEQNYTDLLTTVCNVTIRKKQNVDTRLQLAKRMGVKAEEIVFEEESKDVKIEGIITDEVTIPRNDGTPGSALYSVPFKLNRIPDYTWSKIFVQCWNRPPRFTLMHRPGIARVVSNKIVLDGTTIEEVKNYHRDTLILAVKEANKKYNEYMLMKEREETNRIQKEQQHYSNVIKHANEIEFD